MTANPEVHAAEADLRAEESASQGAGAWPSPRLEYAWMNLPVEDPRFDRTPMSGRSLGLMQSIPWWHSPQQSETGRIKVERARAALAETQWRVRMNIAELAYALQYYSSAEKVLTDQRALAARRVQVARAKYERGSGLEADVLRAEVETAMVEDEQARLQEETRAAAAALAALLGRAPGSPAPIPPPAADVTTPPANLSAVREAAMTSNPGLRAQRAAEAVQAAEQRRIRDAWIPDLRLGASYTRRENVAGDPMAGEDFFSAMLGMDVPLWFPWREMPDAQAATARADSALAMRRDRELALAAEVEAAWLAWRRLVRSWERYRDRILPPLHASVDAALSAYQVGKMDFTGLIGHESLLLRQELHFLQLRRDAAIAAVKVQSLVGVETLPSATPAPREVQP